MSEFPLAWENVRFRTRRYAVSDVRCVLLHRGSVVREIALYDIASVSVAPSAFERVSGVGTLVITLRRPSRPGLETRHANQELRVAGVVRARQAALRLSLVLADIRGLPP